MDRRATRKQIEQLRRQAAMIRADAQTSERDWSKYQRQAQALEQRARELEAELQADIKRRAMAKIHIGRKQLRLDDDAYRVVLHRATGKRRLTEMDNDDLNKVVLEMQRLGARFKPKRRPRPSKEKAHMASKIVAMMKSLNLDDRYVDAMSQRMFGIERWEWLDGEQTTKLLAALAIHQRRRR